MCMQLLVTWLRMFGPVTPQCIQASVQPFNYTPHPSFNMSIMLMSGFYDATLEQKCSHSELGHQSRLSLCISYCVWLRNRSLNIQIMSSVWFMALCSHHSRNLTTGPGPVEARPAHPVSHQRSWKMSWQLSTGPGTSKSSLQSAGITDSLCDDPDTT